MKCEHCKANCVECYAESYESDWYCLTGVKDEERTEFSDGLLGCNLHYKTIAKRLNENATK